MPRPLLLFATVIAGLSVRGFLAVVMLIAPVPLQLIVGSTVLAFLVVDACLE